MIVEWPTFTFGTSVIELVFPVSNKPIFSPKSLALGRSLSILFSSINTPYIKIYISIIIMLI